MVGLATNVHGRSLPGSATAVGLFAHGASVILVCEPGDAPDDIIALVRGDVFGTPQTMRCRCVFSLNAGAPALGTAQTARRCTSSVDEDHRVSGLTLADALV